MRENSSEANSSPSLQTSSQYAGNGKVTLSGCMAELAASLNHNSFNILVEDHSNQTKSIESLRQYFNISIVTQEYFDRPAQRGRLYHKQYTQKWKQVWKNNIADPATQLLNRKGEVVAQRDVNDDDFILDLCYRVSPPDDQNEAWCIGPLIRHIPHRSNKQLLGSSDFPPLRLVFTRIRKHPPVILFTRLRMFSRKMKYVYTQQLKFPSKFTSPHQKTIPFPIPSQPTKNQIPLHPRHMTTTTKCHSSYHLISNACLP